MSETRRLQRNTNTPAPLLRATGYLAIVAGLFLLTSMAVVLLMVRLALPVTVVIPLTIVILSLTPVIAHRSARRLADP